MFKKFKKLFPGLNQKQEEIAKQPEPESVAEFEVSSAQVSRVQARTALVFDAKKRIFITKKKLSNVALWCPDTQQIVIMTETGKQQVVTVAGHRQDTLAIPFTGYWTENTTAGVGFYFPDRALFQLKNDIFEHQATDDILFVFGPNTKQWQPIAGDWNSDGVATIGLYDKERAKFFLQNQHKGDIKADIEFNFGPRNSNLIPLAGDWNGDGQCTVGLYDVEQGIAMLQNQHRGGVRPDIRFKIIGAQTHWQPIVGDWGKEGVDSLAFWDANTQQVHLKYANSNGGIDKVIDMPSKQENVIPLAILNLLA
ncbi:MAG TPA: hypothetical protein EYQ43_07780 [Methyloprofundus sp.]|nr:hypothetical protein [Methyloprofundus sp.]HIL77996.1 hypothetical protein [Methylococcales bacterium]